MPAGPVPLILGAAVQFRDRWQGRLASIEVDEEWEVLNLAVRRGMLRWATSIKLPFSAVPDWSDERVSFDCTSRQAFAREVPPVAAPARPLSADAATSMPDARLSGLLVEPTTRRASEVIIRLPGGLKGRLPVRDVSFEGKMLRIAAQAESLAPYLKDEELSLRATQMLDATLAGDERRSVSADVHSGVVTLNGNVRTKQTREWLADLVETLEGATARHSEVVDDMELELRTGQALARSGLSRNAGIYARSALGEVTLFGYAPATVDEIVRVASRVPGVRRVKSRIEAAAQLATGHV